MCRVAIGQSGSHTLLIVGIRGVPKMEKESGHLALLGWRKGRNAALDFVNVHGVQNTAGSVQGKRAKSVANLCYIRREYRKGWEV